MNLALFVTTANCEEVTSAVIQFKERQKSLVNGALAIVYQNRVPEKHIKAILTILGPAFKVQAILPVHANMSASKNAQMALLFSRFLMNLYAKYPGPWLLMDEIVLPEKDNFMQEMSQLHLGLGGNMTGRCTLGRGALVPVGPVSISVPASQLKFLRFPTNESWRNRGQFYFARCGFKIVSHDQWIFDKGEHAVVTPEVVSLTNAIDEVEVLPTPTVALSQMSRDDIADLIEKKTGKRPHNLLGMNKLLAIASTLES